MNNIQVAKVKHHVLKLLQNVETEFTNKLVYYIMYPAYYWKSERHVFVQWDHAMNGIYGNRP